MEQASREAVHDLLHGMDRAEARRVVVSARDGVWVGSDGQRARTGLTWVSDDLQRFSYEEGPPGTGFRAGGALLLLPSSSSRPVSTR